MTQSREEGKLIPVKLTPPEALTPAERAEIMEARKILEHHGIADRLTRAIGTPISASMRLLPSSVQGLIQTAVDRSLTKALDAAIHTLSPADTAQEPRLRGNQWMAGLVGAAGGAFGPAVLAAELPVSTILILRSVADIARSQGEDLEHLETRLACLEVFALDSGGAAAKASGKASPSGKGATDVSEDATEIGYFAVRAAMAKQVAGATKYLASAKVIDHSAPPLVRFISEIGKRFGVVVGQKVAAQAVPVIGAIGGALINSYFIDHYQDLARAHFTIRRLERKYGTLTVQRIYQSSPE